MSDKLTRKSESNHFSLEHLEKNKRIFQITGIDVTVLIVPVIMLIWIQSGLSFNEMILLQGIFMLPMLLLEIPSGSFADYWSRKGNIVLFHLIFGAGIFIYAIGESFIMFAVAELLAGIGIAFKTGSDSALMYDSLKTKYKDPNGIFGKLIANRMSLMFFGSAIGAIFGGYLASYTNLLRLPVFLAFLGHIVLACIVYFGYTEPPRIQAESPKAAFITAVGSLRKKELQLILIVALSAIVFTNIGFWASQHTFANDYSINAFEMGIIMASLNICASLSSYIIRTKIALLENSIFNLFILLLVDGLYVLALIPASSLAGLMVVSLIGQLSRGARTPITQSLMQNNLSSTERATFGSLISFFGSGMYFLLSNILVIYNFSRVESLTIGLTGIVIGLVLFILLVSYGIKFKRKNPTKLSM